MNPEDRWYVIPSGGEESGGGAAAPPGASLRSTRQRKPRIIQPISDSGTLGGMGDSSTLDQAYGSEGRLVGDEILSLAEAQPLGLPELS